MFKYKQFCPSRYLTEILPPKNLYATLQSNLAFGHYQVNGHTHPHTNMNHEIFLPSKRMLLAYPLTFSENTNHTQKIQIICKESSKNCDTDFFCS